MESLPKKIPRRENPNFILIVRTMFIIYFTRPTFVYQAIAADELKLKEEIIFWEKKQPPMYSTR